VFSRLKSTSDWNNTTATGSSTPFTSATTISDGAELGGSTDAGSTIPPYQAVYVWERTA